jgi:single-strand DNA-binding protein
MISHKSITVIGNLGGDPVLEYAGSGTAYAKFSVGVNNDKYNRSTQGYDKDTIWVDVTCFGKTAEKMSEKLKTGDRVLVDGQLDQNRWKDKNTGDLKYGNVKMTADRVTADSSREGLSSNGL